MICPDAWSFPFLTTPSLSQYTHFIALEPNLTEYYSNHGLTDQCPEKRVEADAILGQLRSTLGEKNFREIESHILARVSHKSTKVPTEKAPTVASQIDDKKFDYLFGRATGHEHNLARTNQNSLEMKRLGIPDTPKGHTLLRSHLNNTLQNNSSILKTFKNEWGSFEVRESLFVGPSGKFSKFESTWQVLPDGTRRFGTLIPRGGGGK
jgi:filamentous hemagglutinin